MDIRYKLGKLTYNLMGDLLSIFPVKKNKIMMFSYSGKQYSCNPKYITEYILDNFEKKPKIIWAIKDIDNAKPIDGVTFVKMNRLKYFYHLGTAKVIVTNSRADYFKKKKNQYYIQTWHSSLRLKQIEGDVEAYLDKDYVNLAKKDSEKCDLLISGCKYSTDIFKRAFWYNGEILECGTPRNDIFFSQNNKYKEIKKKIGVSNDTNIILYAPTFRNSKNLDVYNLDFNRVVEVFEKRFGGKWICAMRLHPNLYEKFSDIKENKRLINLSKYDDIQELLSVSDAVISDYSSLVFDYALTKKPCFLYTPDLNDYIRAERKLYFNINKLPFYLSENIDNLITNIENFDEDKYKNEINKFIDYIGTYENGHASEKVAQRIATVLG